MLHDVIVCCFGFDEEIGDDDMMIGLLVMMMIRSSTCSCRRMGAAVAGSARRSRTPAE